MNQVKKILREKHWCWAIVFRLDGFHPVWGPASRRNGFAAPAAGARTISFSAEKETVLDSKEKRGGSSEPSVDVYGGWHLSYDCGDPFRPLRPAFVVHG